MLKKNLASRSVIGIILILAPQIFSFALALDIFVPSLPAIKLEFSANQFLMQLTISLFVLTTGLGQLFFGPVSDQIGRRKIVLSSIILFTIGSLMSAISPHIYIFIMGRMIQALGACGMMVSAFAIVRDLFSGDDCGKIYSLLNSTIALSPLLAPTLGGYLQYWISWRASFIFLALLGIIILIFAMININETLASNNRRNLKKEIFYDYYVVLKNRKFLIYTLCAAAGFSGFLTFFSSSAYIIISLLEIPEQHFGFYFASIGLLFFIGSLISGYCIKRYGTYKTLVMGAFLMALSGLVMIAWYSLYSLSISAFMGPMLIMGIGGAMLMGAGAGGAIEPFPEMAGTASALFGSIEFICAFLVSQITLEWEIKSTLPLGYTLTVLGFFAILISTAHYKKLRAYSNHT